jgi:hypothetical protein
LIPIVFQDAIPTRLSVFAINKKDDSARVMLWVAGAPDVSCAIRTSIRSGCRRPTNCARSSSGKKPLKNCDVTPLREGDGVRGSRLLLSCSSRSTSSASNDARFLIGTPVRRRSFTLGLPEQGIHVQPERTPGLLFLGREPLQGLWIAKAGQVWSALPVFESRNHGPGQLHAILVRGGLKVLGPRRQVGLEPIQSLRSEA